MKKILILFLFLLSINACDKDTESNEEDNEISFTGETINIIGGTFQMGSNDGNDKEKPIHSVTIDNFRISKYEITNLQYATYMNAIGANSNGTYNGTQYINMESDFSEIDFIDGEFIPKIGKNNFPVIEISWFGAKAFCEYYDGRLPTEAEWEFAAKGGNSNNEFIYSGSNLIDDVAWYTSNSNGTSHLIGTKNANELGIYDMSGNVGEWINDWYEADYYNNSPSNNPQGPSSGNRRVARGNCWNDLAYFCRIAYRNHGIPSYTGNCLGFRPVFNQ